MIMLAIDPGKGATKTIGLAKFVDNQLTEAHQMTFPEMVRYINDRENRVVSDIVYESYMVRPDKLKENVGTMVETAQCIGAIRAVAVLYDINLTMQNASILPIASRQFQIKIPTNHAKSHSFCAILHGMYFLHRRGLIKSALEEKMSK
jgi:hypothetical protein